jgi:hypothetical protein
VQPLAALLFIGCHAGLVVAPTASPSTPLIKCFQSHFSNCGIGVLVVGGSIHVSAAANDGSHQEVFNQGLGPAPPAMPHSPAGGSSFTECNCAICCVGGGFLARAGGGMGCWEEGTLCNGWGAGLGTGAGMKCGTRPWCTTDIQPGLLDVGSLETLMVHMYRGMPLSSSQADMPGVPHDAWLNSTPAACSM